METEQKKFGESLNTMKKTINSLFIYNNSEDYLKNFEIVETIKKKLKSTEEQAKLFNKREIMFARKQSDYSSIQKMKKNFQPYFDLWKTVKYWVENKPKWLNDYWDTVDSHSAETFMDYGIRTLLSISKFLREKSKEDKDNSINIQKITLISQTIRKEIELFKPKIPLLVALKKPGMKQRHWEEIFKKTNNSFIVNENLTFQKLLDEGMLSHIKVCCEIGEKAEKEFHIENLLNEMQTIWQEVNFSLHQHKETGVWVINNYEEIENKVDEHLGTTQMLLVNPFNKPYAATIQGWFEQLMLMSNTLEEWKRLQSHWCYLQSIFDSPDIVNKLTNESTMFKKVDNFFTKTMSQTKVQKKVLKICISEDHLDNFISNNKNLENIKKALHKYLETKRSIFGRFYFLSNDALLSILSETKEVERIQDHLRKVFENIAKLDFNEEKIIQGMSSVKNEYVSFGEYSVDPKLKAVEYWMKEVESAIQLSLKKSLLEAVEDYDKCPRTEWMFKHPGQCVLEGSQIFWTNLVEENITKNRLEDYFALIKSQIEDIVKIDKSGLSKNQITSMEALIIMDVHSRDVVSKLISKKVDSSFSFEWISQLRYYIDNLKDLRVKCLQTNFPYDYEYWGNSTRLVITPLTEKCYITLMSALKLNLGGSPAGPAGTGKTETVKNLAKSMGKQCVVFNCQKSMSHHFVAQYFKGLASTGAWCCLDEFNLINPEVLSVIAQQLQELFRAKTDGSKVIVFDNSTIELKPTFSVFVTMNPNYAGRTALPDNLQALFRPIAMMVPDYAIIGEIKLYSYGFLSAYSMSKKMVATFKLSSEQLSEQKHYDYGLRAVTALVNIAGIIKKNNPHMTEEQILLKALKDVNEPKFLKQDLPLFSNIVKDLFPEAKQIENNYSHIEPHYLAACEQLRLKPVDPFTQKVFQLYDTLQVRHGIMVVGPSGGGKSSVCSVLKETLSRYNPIKGLKQDERIIIKSINPKAVTREQLFGETKEMNWNPGIIEVEMENAIQNQYHPTKSQQQFWLLFDGQVDPSWIEFMNTTLDDNRKLCLSSGKVLLLSPYINLFFEVENLDKASPATVSRCGMVYMEPENLGYDVLFQSFLKIEKFAKIFNEMFKIKFKKLISALFDPILKFIRQNCQEIVKTQNCNLVSSFCKLFSTFINEVNIFHFQGKEGIRELQKYIQERLPNLFVYCLIWSVCSTLDFKSRTFVDSFLSNLLDSLSIDFEFAISDCFFDKKYNFEENVFTNWQNVNVSLMESTLESGSMDHNELIIPTKQFISTLNIKLRLFKNKVNVMIPGPTGTGKSTNALCFLSQKLDNSFISSSIVLSAQTHLNQIQELIFSKIIKRKRHYYGPASMKKLIVFIDDINMPERKEYGDQPPLELIRQLLDSQGCYVWNTLKEYSHLEDVLILAAMNPKARDPLNERFLRQFYILGFPELDKTTLNIIFDSILKKGLRKYSEPIKMLIPKIIEKELEIFSYIKSVLLPIPSKPHYQFNLRDITRVFHGLSQSSHSLIQTEKDMLELWVHENQRVFKDRLITEEDEAIFDRCINEHLLSFSFSLKSLTQNKKLLFVDFLEGIDSDRIYQKISSEKEFKETLSNLQTEYNDNVSDVSRKLNLVLFLDACDHIGRICRIISRPEGHALLLGVGGSGRKSLTSLSSFINLQKLCRITVGKGYDFDKWRENLKEVILLAISQNRQLTFLLNDTEMIDTRMLEDINCLLNTGNILGLNLNQDENKKIESAGKAECLKKGLPINAVNISQQAVQLVKKNTHIVFCMSPLTNGFLDKLRMFPSLISCCTIDWFHKWPKEALLEVASQELNKTTDSTVHLKLKDYFAYSQIFIEKKCQQMSSEINRKNFVTPTSYLELLKSFTNILVNKRNENEKAIKRLKNGIEKLKSANEDVRELQKQLEIEEPELKITEKEVEQMISKIEQDTKFADNKRKQVMKEEKEAEEAQKKAKILSDEVDKTVAIANKNLSKIKDKMKELKQENINELKALDKPHQKILYIYIAGTLLLTDYSQLKVKNNWKEEEEEQYFFKYFKFNYLKDQKFLSNIQTMDFGKIDPRRLRRIKAKVIEHPKRKQFWNDKEMYNCNLAAYCLYLLVEAAIKFNEMTEINKPLLEKKQKIDTLVQEKNMILQEKNLEIRLITEKLSNLKIMFKKKNDEMEELKNKITSCSVKLERAKKLTDLLADENERWSQEIKSLHELKSFILGDSCLGATMLTYAGAFPSDYRKDIENELVNILDEYAIQHSKNLSMVTCLGDEVKIQNWKTHGLPKDTTSIQNGIMIELSLRWTFLIDPQRQGLKFLKNYARDHENGLDVIKASDKNFSKKLEQSIQFGKILILENCPTKLEPGLDPLLLKKFKYVNGGLVLTLGDKIIPYSSDFKLLMVSSQENPDFTPETCAKVTIINFCATPTGLVEQMLATIVILENRQLEDKKNNILRMNAKNKRELIDIEDDILKNLNESSQEFLMDSSLVNKLASSKRKSSEIKAKVQDSLITEKKIDSARENYRELAIKVSTLYFAISDLKKLDSMYEYSLQWFDNLFRSSVEAAENGNDLSQRLSNLISKFTEMLYKNVCRSLFESHKLLFSFLICIRLLQIEHKIDEKELKYLYMGEKETEMRENPTDYIPETIWPSFYQKLSSLNHLPNFESLESNFFMNPASFKYLYDSENPYKEILPIFIDDNISESPFSKLLLVKLFREDKLMSSIECFIEERMGENYIKPPSFNLQECYNDSSSCIPLVFLLSSGSDPKSDFDKLAMEMEITDIKSISLGSGQGEKAEDMIIKAMKSGSWILLQNCHLASSWMPKLEEICEGLSEGVSKDFRLWLTSMPSPDFPISILQNSVKMTLEPPKGLNANLKRSFMSFDDEKFNNSTPSFKKLSYSLSFFHAVIQGRRQFGPIGWNIPYSFTFEDFQVSLKQLNNILLEYKDDPFTILNFLIAKINYGGRVTDSNDKRLIKSLLKNYMTPDCFKNSYSFSESGNFLSPPIADKDEYMKFIDREIPLNPNSEVYFLHENAQITTLETNCKRFNYQLLELQSNKGSSTGQSSEINENLELVEEILEKIPEGFNAKDVQEKYPTNYEESMNTIITQEIIRFNSLVGKVTKDLDNLKKALEGKQVFSKDLEKMESDLVKMQVPSQWGYPLGFLSLKPLNSWIQEFRERKAFLLDWYEHGKPGTFWFAGFFSPQAFITGTLQNFARKHNIAIDQVGFDFIVRDDKDVEQIQEERSGPIEGVYVTGIYLEGAIWDSSAHLITQPIKRQLFAEVPLIHLMPRPFNEIFIRSRYKCPLYKVVSRAGTLSTTGHSTNFIFYLYFNSELPVDYWIRRGVAAFLSLSY